jgi:hypothetical protein
MKKGPFLILAIAAATSAAAQSRTHASPPSADSARMAGMADHAMSGPMTANMMKHMELTPARTATHDDTLRARKLVAELKRAIGKYQDTAAAVADGYHLFLPNAKEQHVYHFTNYGRAFKEVFRFNPAEPTSVLYQKTTDGTLELVGAMYTMPRAARLSRLDGRVPLGLARWHKHVNWCLPRKGEQARYTETFADGQPKFGPESPIATKAECDGVRGDFHPSLFGWMVHVNVARGDDLGSIFGDEHHR